MPEPKQRYVIELYLEQEADGRWTASGELFDSSPYWKKTGAGIPIGVPEPHWSSPVQPLVGAVVDSLRALASKQGAGHLTPEASSQHETAFRDWLTHTWPQYLELETVWAPWQYHFVRGR